MGTGGEGGAGVDFGPKIDVIVILIMIAWTIIMRGDGTQAQIGLLLSMGGEWGGCRHISSIDSNKGRCSACLGHVHCSRCM